MRITKWAYHQGQGNFFLAQRFGRKAELLGKPLSLEVTATNYESLQMNLMTGHSLLNLQILGFQRIWGNSRHLHRSAKFILLQKPFIMAGFLRSSNCFHQLVLTTLHDVSTPHTATACGKAGVPADTVPSPRDLTRDSTIISSKCPKGGVFILGSFA